MVNSFSLILMSAVFILILLVYFINKSHINTLELRLYKYLLIVNFIGLLLEMLCIITIAYLPEYNALTIIVNRLYLLYFVVFTSIFSIYTLNVSRGKDVFDDIFNKNKKYIYLVVSVVTLLVVYLPIEFNYGDIAYSYGIAVDVLYGYAFLNIIICIMIMITNLKSIKSRKYIPLIIYIFGSGVVGFIQKINPELTLSTTMDAMVLFIIVNYQ